MLHIVGTIYLPETSVVPEAVAGQLKRGTDYYQTRFQSTSGSITVLCGGRRLPPIDELLLSGSGPSKPSRVCDVC